MTKMFYYHLAALIFIASSSGAQPQPRPTVAILLFEGVQIIDYTGPYEVFGQAGYTVFTVAETAQPIVTNMNMKVTPTHTLTTAPAADILVVPGGRVPHDLPPDHPLVNWVREREPNTRYILTVCNGAFLVGSTGLLNGRHATTTAGMIDHMSMFIENVKPVYDKRFVEDGKIITAGGLSAGIDAALYVVSQIDTKGRARQVANNMEYNWDTQNGYSRTALVDYQLAKLLDFNPPIRGKVLVYDGDQNSWQASFEISRRETLEQFFGQMELQATGQGWTNISKSKTEQKAIGQWKMKDHKQQNWRLEAEFTQLAENRFTASFSLSREAK